MSDYIDRRGKRTLANCSLVKKQVKLGVARYGNLQIFPNPTDAPAADSTKPIFPEKVLLLFFCVSISLLPLICSYCRSGFPFLTPKIFVS